MIPDFDMSNEKIFSLEKFAEEINSDNLPVFIFGCASLAERVDKILREIGVNINGWVTDNPKMQKSTVLFKDELIKNYPRYSLVKGFDRLGYVSDEEIKALWSGCEKVYNIPNLTDSFYPESKITREFYLENKAAFNTVYDNLADELSKKSLAAFIKARMLKRNEVLAPVAVRPQYFFTPPLWNKNPNEVMIDCGAFDGDSIFDFIQFNGGKYKQVIACEPDPTNLAKLQENICARDVKNILVLNLGVGDKKATLKFDSQANAGSVISDAGNITISVDTIDSVETAVGGGISLIKMDIEGFELSALRGAENTIIKNRPVLAISAYHKKDDVFSIYQYLNGIVQGYRFYFRCHRFDTMDAVMYAVPAERTAQNLEL